jgi:DNA-binding MarR family transcriptional regulator
VAEAGGRGATEEPPEFESPDHVLLLLKRAFNHGRRTVTDAISSHGATSSQLSLMNRLAREPGLSGAELARRSLVTPQAAQLGLTMLERRGWVERRPDPAHKRILRSYLTAEGERVRMACVADAMRSQEAMLSVFDDRERETLRRLLLRFVEQRQGR